jgi:hypothetical protein
MKPRYRSLPEFLHTPWCLLWAGLLPQGLLALLNARAWLLVRGEVSELQTRLFDTLGGYEIALLIIMAVLLIALRWRRSPLSWIICIPLFLAHVSYLWLVTIYMKDLLPTEVTRWMLPPQVFLFSQFTLMMPAVFYFAARSACFPMTNHPLKDIGITTGTVITVPVLWYLGIRFVFRIHDFDMPELVWIVFWVVSTILTIMAFLRLLMMAYKWTCRVQRHRWIFVLLAALAAPVGGLSLNAAIPFPVDLQYPAIYVLTVLNAVVLLIPRLEDRAWLTRIWFARCAALPFSLYFFLLFLPFLPLSLPAMFAAGAGFLILAPTFLFAIHVQLLIDEGKQVISILGHGRTALCVLAALALLPGILTLDALLDRRNLTAAIDAVYTPDTLSQPRISARRAARALKRLDADKQGVYLPFISGAYRQLVFDGMVLQDRKIAEMVELFTGEPLESAEGRRNRNILFDFWSGWRGTTRGRGVPPPPRHTVTLQTTDVSRVVSDGMVSATLSLTLTNANRSNAEYVTRLALSPGVLVSGYWLDVEGEKKPGRLYEKRAAMWVYHMIRDIVRRDPGLLIFEGPQTLKLNVYPFAPNQTRETGIEFLFPAGMPATVTVDGRHLNLAPSASSPAAEPLLLQGASPSTSVVAFTGTESSQEAAVTRTPVVHLLIDRSAAASETSAARWQQRLDTLEARLPSNARYHVAAVNHSTHVLTPEPVDFAEARDVIAQIEKIKPQGGIAHHQAIRRGVAAWREKPLQTRRKSVPMFLLLLGPNSVPTPIESLSGLEVFTPDVQGYWVDSSNALTHCSYQTAESEPAGQRFTPPPVVFPITNSAECLLPGQAGTLVVDPTDISVEGIRLVSDLAAQYVAGTELWSQWYDTVVNPALLDERYQALVADSRACGIMIPVTSFMVVENSAQEAMLERKHKEAVHAQSALDFDEHQESPEPGFWLLLIPALLLANRKSRFRTSVRGGERRRLARALPSAS